MKLEKYGLSSFSFFYLNRWIVNRTAITATVPTASATMSHQSQQFPLALESPYSLPNPRPIGKSQQEANAGANAKKDLIYRKLTSVAAAQTNA